MMPLPHTASLSSSAFQYNKDWSFLFPNAEGFEGIRQAASMISEPGSSVQVVTLACPPLEILMKLWADQ